MDLEGIALSEISQTEEDKLYNITYMWNLKNPTQSRNVVVRGRGNREVLVKRYKLSAIRQIRYENLMYNMVTS